MYKFLWKEKNVFTQRTINWLRRRISFLLTNNQCGPSNDSYPILPCPFFVLTYKCTQIEHPDSSKICPSSFTVLFVFPSPVGHCLSKEQDLILVSINLKGLECIVRCIGSPALKANLNLTKFSSGHVVVWSNYICAERCADITLIGSNNVSCSCIRLCITGTLVCLHT